MSEKFDPACPIHGGGCPNCTCGQQTPSLALLAELRERASKHLVQCGACDAGLPMMCQCQYAGDPRPLINELLIFIDALLASDGKIIDSKRAS